MRRKSMRAPAAVAAALLLAVLTACSQTSEPTGGDDPADETTSEATGEESEGGDETEWFDQALFDEQDEQRSATFEGDPEQPYLQYIDGEMADTSSFKSSGAKKACFANA